MIITDSILYASQFVEYYTGKYFINCDTFKEARQCLKSEHIYIKKGYTFKETDKLNKDAAYVVVSFSLEEDYTKYEYIIMRIQKKYLNRFIRNMNTYKNDT